jgi:hypothetical protein
MVLEFMWMLLVIIILVIIASEVLKIQVVVLNLLLSFIEYSFLRRLHTTHQRLAPS